MDQIKSLEKHQFINDLHDVIYCSQQLRDYENTPSDEVNRSRSFIVKAHLLMLRDFVAKWGPKDQLFYSQYATLQPHQFMSANLLDSLISLGVGMHPLLFYSLSSSLINLTAITTAITHPNTMRSAPPENIQNTKTLSAFIIASSIFFLPFSVVFVISIDKGHPTNGPIGSLANSSCKRHRRP